MLQYLIVTWSTDLQCLNVRGQQLTFSVVEDGYFFWGSNCMGWPFLLTPRSRGMSEWVTWDSPLLRTEPNVRFVHPD
jgi:hypothetical protein